MKGMNSAKRGQIVVCIDDTNPYADRLDILQMPPLTIGEEYVVTRFFSNTACVTLEGITFESVMCPGERLGYHFNVDRFVSRRAYKKLGPAGANPPGREKAKLLST